MITSEQIRAARAMLRWTAQELADKAGLSLSTVQRMELGTGLPGGLAKNVEAVEVALKNAGMVFTSKGLERQEVRND